MTSAQIRAARALLNWTVRGLAEKAGVHRNTISNLETDRSPDPYSLGQVVAALEKAGVVFMAEGETTNGGPGVRLVKARKATRR